MQPKIDSRIDQKKLCDIITQLISALGDDPDRPGLQETPERTAKMFAEMFEGMNYTNSEIAQMFSKCFEHASSNDWVLVKDIEIFSFCEHHFALMYNMHTHIAYKPSGRVIGLSKIARIASMAAKRLQLQERIANDISEILQEVLDTSDVMVVVEGEHSCMSARGIRAQGAKTRTCTTSGIFAEDTTLRQEVLSQI